MYTFFRARTLGYDVYPEDFFLRNFPWQQYGGLWIVNEARFARAEPVNALTAQNLRRITGVGASPRSRDSGRPTSYLTDSSFGHQPLKATELQNGMCSQSIPISPFDGSFGGQLTTSGFGNNSPILNMSALKASSLQSVVVRPNLTILTDVGRRYPGFPTPLSPTLSAKELYPTPTSEPGSRSATPSQDHTLCSVSPMSIDGSSMCGPSTRCVSHSYEYFAEKMGNIDDIINRGDNGRYTRSSSRASFTSPLSPAGSKSPQRALSPRAGMLRHMAATQALHGMHNQFALPDPRARFSPNARNVRRDSIMSNNSLASTFSPPSPSSLSARAKWEKTGRLAPLSVQIANGTEFETGSPISPTGTMLSYASSRAVDSGLLAVPALSEPQVAEYRFWVPCGRRVCAFGCGRAHEGEDAAAKRLFKEADSVERQVADEGYGFGGDEHSYEELQSVVSKQDLRRDSGMMSLTRPAADWEMFLRNKERDVSIARV